MRTTRTKATAKKVAKQVDGRDPMLVPVTRIMARKVRTVRGGMSLEAAMDLMMQAEIGHLPVVDDDGRLVGILSKTDLVRERFINGDTGSTEVRFPGKNGVSYSPGPGFHEAVEANKSVADLMSTRVRTVRDDATVAEAALAMSKHRVHGLPVVSTKNALVGFLSTFDIVDWVAAG